jgi:hypothetical protein
MCVWVWVSVCECVWVSVCEWVSVSECVCVCAWVSECEWMCVSECVSECVWVCVWVCVSECVCVSVWVRVCVCVWVCVWVCMSVCVYKWVCVWVKHSLFLSDFNESSKLLQHHTSLKSVQLESISSMRTDRQTDRHKAKSRFLPKAPIKTSSLFQTLSLDFFCQVPILHQQQSSNCPVDISVFYPSTSRQKPWQCFKSRPDRFLPHPLHSVTQCRPNTFGKPQIIKNQPDCSFRPLFVPSPQTFPVTADRRVYCSLLNALRADGLIYVPCGPEEPPCPVCCDVA